MQAQIEEQHSNKAAELEKVKQQADATEMERASTARDMSMCAGRAAEQRTDGYCVIPGSLPSRKCTWRMRAILQALP